MIVRMASFTKIGDIMKPNGEKEKQIIPISSLKDALNYAEQDIKDKWVSYKERYSKKLKK